MRDKTRIRSDGSYLVFFFDSVRIPPFFFSTPTLRELWVKNNKPKRKSIDIYYE